MAHKSYNAYCAALSGKCLLTPGTEEGGLTLQGSGSLPEAVRAELCFGR